MSIDWGALGVVSIVTLIGTVFVVCVVSCAALLMDLSHARAGCCAAILLFGLWLIIPYFH